MKIFSVFPLIIIGLSALSVNASSPEEIPTDTPQKMPSRFVTYEVLIKIRAKGSGRPLKRTEIKFEDKLLYTDAQGELRFIATAESQSILKISRFGYETITLKLEELGDSKEREFFLLPAPPSDNEVLIQGIKRPEVSRKTISASEAARVSASGDPAKVTKLLPGVQSNQFGNRVVIRGSGPNDSAYYIDDIEIPEIFHRVGNISVLPEKLINEVEFSSGGFGAQRGNRHGGIITLRSTNEIPEYPSTEYRVNLPLYSGLLHERPIGEKSSITVSARRSYIEKFIPLVTKKTKGLTLVPVFGDVHVRYLQKTETGHNKLLLLGSYDALKLLANIDASTSEDGRGRFNIENTFAVLGFENSSSIGNGWTLNTTPSILYSIEDSEILDNHFRGKTALTTLTVEARKRRSKDESWYIGTSYNNIVANLDIQAPISRGNDPFFDFEEASKSTFRRKFEKNEFAMWTIYDQKIGDSVLTPSVRFFYNDQVHRTGFDPRLSSRWALDSQHLVKGAVGQYSQGPERSEGSVEFGNPDLTFERCYHYILGYEWKPTDRFETDFQVFHKQTQNLIVADDIKRYSNKGERRSSGFELFIRRNPTEKLFGWISYTYSKTEERNTSDDSFQAGPNDQTHVASVAGDYRFTAVWSLGGALSYHTGDTLTPAQDAVFNANLDKYQPRYSDSARYSDRLPNFHQLDIYTTYDFYRDLSKISLRVGVQGLAVKKQVTNIQYNYDYSSKEAFQPLPAIPFVELKGVF